MPIDRDRFEADEALREPSTSELVLRYLLANDDRAFTRREIADAIGSNPETVGTNLTRLKDRRLVQHREPYWAIEADQTAVIDAMRERGGGRSRAIPVSASNRDEPGRRDPGRPHREAAAAFVERARDRLDDVIAGLYLFGSVARGTETEPSDVDILVVIADDADYRTVDDELLDIAYDVQLECTVPVELHSIRASEFAARQNRGDPFVRNVLEEGTVVA